MTIKPKRKVIGSITGEVFETTSGKIPRRRLPDGKTETGKELPADHPEYVGEQPKSNIVVGDIDIQVEEDDGLDWKPAEMVLEGGDSKPTGTIDVQKVPRPEAKRDKQPPKTTPKDLDKMQDLFFALSCAVDEKQYSAEEKAQIISKLFADTTDVRVETLQYVMSGTTYGMMAGIVGIMVLLKGQSGGLLGKYRSLFPKGQTKMDDELWEGK